MVAWRGNTGRFGVASVGSCKVERVFGETSSKARDELGLGLLLRRFGEDMLLGDFENMVPSMASGVSCSWKASCGAPWSV